MKKSENIERVIVYKPSKIIPLVMFILGIAITFTIDIDQLLKFYKDIELTLLILFVVVGLPIFLLFGFSVKLYQDKIIYRHNLFFRKAFMLSDLSHVLYQVTWRGVSSKAKTARSLHVVRNSGGLRETISIANGAFRERDLADMADRLIHMNPSVKTDEHVENLIKKHGNGKI